MQAFANAIVEGECLSATAIASVAVEAGPTVEASSTCGMTADVIEFDPAADGPVAASTDEAATVAAAPLTNPAEEKEAGEIVQSLIETTPIADVSPAVAPVTAG
jgi:hypothetical protein